MPTAIEFNNISKLYRLGLVSTGTLAHDFKRWWTINVKRQEDPYLRIGETNDRSTKGESEYVWALKDIDFKVEQGDVVGIIGKNGAGKSTLLKILSKVTAPTTGTIRARGRIGSLLEVGTGFHPEMTGRENIYMNGAILGMTKQEIGRKLDEIIDFSGCERYIDTPVKRYSSGMLVRLGFAVAAHLDPEILVVDEVLAVGDAEFQKKAIGKMQDVSRGEGRTVLFVSHNMATIKSLCINGILLENGKIVYSGNAVNTVNHYLASGIVETDSIVDISESPKRLPRMKKVLTRVELKKRNGDNTNTFYQDEDIYLFVSYDASREENVAGCGYIIYSEDEVRVGGGNTYMAFPPPHKLPRTGTIVFHLNPKQFTPGSYNFTVSVGSHQSILLDKVMHCISFTIEPSDIYGNGYILTKEDGVSSLHFDAKLLNQ